VKGGVDTLYYNLELFGESVCNIRNNVGFTQKYVSELTTINIDTLRKIENGKITPQHSTLEILSPILKVDLNQLLLNFRFPDYANFNEVISRIDLKLESGEFDQLQDELPFLSTILNDKNVTTYVSKLIKQYYSFVESVILKTNDNNYSECLTKLVESIKVTSPNFDLLTYANYVYNNMEIRILMNLALILNLIESNYKGLEILLFCLNSINDDQIEFKIKILYNLAYTYHKLDLSEKALYYSNIGIDTCVANKSLSCLALLQTRKGIAEYHLDIEDYKNSLIKAIAILDITGQTKLKDMLIRSWKNNYNIVI